MISSALEKMKILKQWNLLYGTFRNGKITGDRSPNNLQQIADLIN